MAQRRRSGDALLGAARVPGRRARADSSAHGPTGIEDDRPSAAAHASGPGRRAASSCRTADFATRTLPAILDTLVNPDAVAADASRDRLDLAKNAGALELALDTADTIQAADGLERMLAHQLAATHVAAMKAAAVMGQQLDIADRTYGHGQAGGVRRGGPAGGRRGPAERIVPGRAADPAAGPLRAARQVVVVQHNARRAPVAKL